MRAGAQIASEHGLYLQTHLDETPAEIQWVLGIYRNYAEFADIQTYTEIYQRCGVLGPRTVMGHAIHLSESEVEMLAKTDTAIASCPSSNAPLAQRGLGSGLFNFKQVESAGIRWALASDIGGGPYLSMFDVIDSFVLQNKSNGNQEATYAKALYRSTQAGAEILGIGDRKGNFAPGKSFDCIQCACAEPSLPTSDAESLVPQIIAQAASRSQRDELVHAMILEGELAYQRGDTREQAGKPSGS